ncbi:MAG: chromosomal replication initiator protein DnaA, partial [Candidatus Parcubacteria bacterium]|nr:chromosomal replication initiator protein DnaA [Candidatus Parcubacteria bacterium]
MELNEIWRNCLGELEVTVSRPNFVTWFKNTFLIDQKNGVFVIGVPNFFYETELRRRYLNDIAKILSKQTNNPNVTIKFKIAAPGPEQIINFDKDKVIHKPVDKSGDKKEPAFLSQSLPQNSTINPYYVFENFVVGPSNQLAYAAADAVSNNPGTSYNPLFIYGESGIGKTHLMQAIGNHLLKKKANTKVVYVTAETFMNDFINAVEQGSGKAKNFKERYRNVDILLIDDIQFFSGKEQTQEEFFHTFNHLHQNSKQVVLTADRIPKAIKGLEKRLQTRFEGGMVADIGAPDMETRAAILRHKAKSKGFEIEDEVIGFIAENIKSSVRELEGALTKIMATCELQKCSPTLQITTKVLNNIIETTRRAITPELILRETCRFYRVGEDDILGRRRNKEIVKPRQIVMYLLYNDLGMSYP